MDKVIIGDATLYHGDCMDILPTLGKVDAVVTDPPYPDLHVPQFGYCEDALSLLPDVHSFIFWTAKKEFPLPYSSIHIWDKKTGVQSQYERIFERNGGGHWRVFNYYFVNSTVAAKMTRDIFYNHASQKPINLIINIVQLVTGATLLDPFMGSGTTGVACANLGRKFIGIEIERKYFDIACERIEAAYAQGRLAL